MWVKCEERLPEKANSGKVYRVIRRGRGKTRREDRLAWMMRDNEWSWYNLCGMKVTAVEEWMEASPDV